MPLLTQSTIFSIWSRTGKGNHKPEFSIVVNCLFTFFLTTLNQQKDHMNPVWPLSPQKDASYYLLHMTPHGKSRAVYIALLQQPPDCLMLVFFSVMNTLSKGWHLRLSMLEINDRSAVITFKHLLSSCLCRMSILQQYHNNIPTLWSQYIVVYTRENMGLKFKKERNLQEVAHYSPQMLISIFF